MSIFHNAASFAHRNPLGAVRCGDKIRISLSAPEGEARGGELVVFGGEFNYRAALARSGETLFCDFTAPDAPTVLWYHFRLHGYPYDFFCGAAENGLSSVVINDLPESFQLTVYERGFETPRWFGGSVMYQIFPDRFSRDGSGTARRGIEYHRKLGRKIRFHEDWGEPVCWQPEDGEDDYYPNDFYGGTLRGITEKLGYLQGLGVGVLYLNPIFEADSNHRYNTADYRKIDPILGTEEDFKELCAKAERLGIRVMLDGVFSHTGSDSIYFNRERRYQSQGAYQGENSPFYQWFDFGGHSDEYRSWWGFPSLPEVNELNPAWQEYIYCGEGAVVPYWLGAGAYGWRLDVADELPDEILAGIYQAAKVKKADSVILGEVWEDPTTKESYGQKRKYALGGMLDTVMNYPLRSALLDFALGKCDAYRLCDFLLHQKLNYPPPMYRALMNLLSSHDVPRLRTALGTDIDVLRADRQMQAELKLSDVENERAKALQRLCAVLQFSLPGVPCIYYGDEQGMQGAFDPFDRQPFVENEPETARFYAEISRMRNESEALKNGGAGFCVVSDDIVCILRIAENEAVLVAVNRGENEVPFSGDAAACFRGLDASERALVDGKSFSLTVGANDWCAIKI